MKRYITHTVVLLALLFSGAACTDVIEVDLPEGETLLAVDGWIYDTPGPYTITLSTTAPYLGQGQTPRATGAVLSIRDSEGFEESLIEVAPGKYQTRQLQGKVGNTYSLQIDWAGQTYVAETAIRPGPSIDSLTYQYKEARGGRKEGYYLYFFGQERESPGDYYHLRLYKNGQYLNKPSQLIFVSDQFVEGSYIHDLEVNWADPFAANDQVRIEMLAITEDTYQFMLELSQQTNNGGMFPNPIANVRTNVRNLNPNGPKAVGYVAGAALDAIGGMVNPETNVIRR